MVDGCNRESKKSCCCGPHGPDGGVTNDGEQNVKHFNNLNQHINHNEYISTINQPREVSPDLSLDSDSDLGLNNVQQLDGDQMSQTKCASHSVALDSALSCVGSSQQSISSQSRPKSRFIPPFKKS